VSISSETTLAGAMATAAVAGGRARHPLVPPENCSEFAFSVRHDEIPGDNSTFGTRVRDVMNFYASAVLNRDFFNVRGALGS
jgi:hypothetical protein